jgi:L-alanine-DL-glutamate epimerase-like enolase superfamily enzyme
MSNADRDLTITALETTLLRVPWTNEPPVNGIMPAADREFILIHLKTAGGLTGLGYLQPLSGGIETLDTCLHEMIAPRVLGRQATEVEAIWRDLWQSTYWLGRGGIATWAQSGIDIALWDLVGKAAGMPLHKLWGTCRSEVEAYGSGVWRGLDRDGTIARARHYTEQGLKAIKMQVAHIRTPREDIANVGAVRDALGPDVEIMVDVNMGWTADTAIQTGRHLDEFDIYWLEEPVVCEDFAGYQRVASHLKTRVVGGESHFTRYDLRPFFTSATSPILQPDPQRGGLTELRKIAAVAETWGMRIAPHLFHELTVHLLASIPNASYLEYMDWNDDIFVDPRKPVGGMIAAPDGPGHSVEFRPELVTNCRIGGRETVAS